MPGILPMKVIKVGSTSQSRIAQACDRCRSKKIRCDGVRPTCSQCASVGFECRTSDKLSRRAFPRGYTETLEERVRTLETEVRELKDLLDQKDEKIDVLSRVHHPITATPPSGHAALPTASTAMAAAADRPGHGRQSHAATATDFVRVRAAAYLDDGNDCFVGPAPVQMLLGAFRERARQLGRSGVEMDVEALMRPARRRQSLYGHSPTTPNRPNVPPRIVSDQLINIYFQEWAPLFPVLHRPTFLSSYEAFCAAPDSFHDRHVRAQLHLVFSIAARSREPSFQADLGSYERQWQDALDNLGLDRSMATLQCLILAGIYCVSAGDQDRLAHYRGRAVALAHRLGLHQNQRSFSLSALSLETRKRVFWCLYALDCLASAALGLPRLLKDSDIQTEGPADADDEYVTEQGFEVPPPGQSTQLSSALALVQACRILARVLDRLYPPAASSYEFTVQDQRSLEDELHRWSNTLAPHLKLQFVRGKPATSVVNSRAPILALVHHYIQLVIHIPTLASGASSQLASSSVHTVADSAARILQIVQLLDERKMSFSLAMNKSDLLFLAGLGILFQAIDLDRKGKLIKDSERSIGSILRMLERDGAPAAPAFRQAAHLVLPAVSPSLDSTGIKAESGAAVPVSKSRSAQKRLQSLASRLYQAGTRVSGAASRRADESRPESTPRSVPDGPSPSLAPAPPSLYSNVQSSPVIPQLGRPAYAQTMPPRMRSHLGAPNLDYLSFATEPLTANAELSAKLEAAGPGAFHQHDDWQSFATSFEPGPNVAAYHHHHDPRPAPSPLQTDAPPGVGVVVSAPSSAGPMAHAPDLWRRPSLQPVPPQPSLTYSEESVATTGDLTNGGGGGGEMSSAQDDPFRGMVLPTTTASSMGGDGFGYDRYDAAYGL